MIGSTLQIYTLILNCNKQKKTPPTIEDNHRWWYCVGVEWLEHVANLDVEVGTLVVVLLVEGGAPVDRDDEVVVHADLQSAAGSKMESMEVAFEVATHILTPIRIMRYPIIYNVRKIIVCLQHHTGIDEGVEAEIEVLLANLEVVELDT